MFTTRNIQVFISNRVLNGDMNAVECKYVFRNRRLWFQCDSLPVSSATLLPWPESVRIGKSWRYALMSPKQKLAMARDGDFYEQFHQRARLFMTYCLLPAKEYSDSY